MAIHTRTDDLPDGRGQAILSAIIREHVLTGEPVGSRSVAQACASRAGWSSATIRNVMAELEDAGFVEQPHTSAGRVPTDKGYRFYVDHKVTSQRLGRADQALINRTLTAGKQQRHNQPQQLMETISHLLSEISENIGIVLSPSFTENLLQHIEFVHLTDGRVLVVLVFQPNIVQHKIIRLTEQIGQAELERTARYLNAEFNGQSLPQIRAEIVQRLGEEKALYDRLLQCAAMLCEESLAGEDEASGELFVDGASNILTKPDFADTERLRELFRTLEEKSRLVKILNECMTQGAGSAQTSGNLSVRIGRENNVSSLQGCALITASYRIGAGAATGTLGVVGPVRIEYERVMSVVDYIARNVELILSAEGASNQSEKS